MNLHTSLVSRPAETCTPAADAAARGAAAEARGTLGDLLRLLPGWPEPGALANPTPLAWIRLRSNEVLVHEGARSQALFVVRYGSTKSVKTLEDGYEQVLSFAQPGDVLGFDAIHLGRHPATVVALEDASVYLLPLRDLQSLEDLCPALATALQRGLSRQLADAAAMPELMSAVASEVRLARFLLWWSARMARVGRSARRLHLRMGRRDIASIIGVAHATVSRSFTTLAEEGLLSVDNRDVEILDLDALRVRARNTRGGAADAGWPASGPDADGVERWSRAQP